MARPVLMLHGWATDGSSFDDLIRRLGPDYSCVAPDLPGHASAADKTPSLAECAKVAADALAQMDGDALIIGWSMGAAVAWEMIRTQGTDGMAGLITIDMSPKIANGPDWSFGVLGQDDSGPVPGAGITANWDEMAGNIVRGMMFASDAGSEGWPLETAIAHVQGCDPAPMAALWDDMITKDYRDVVAALNLPWLATRGSASAFFAPEMSDWLVQTAPNAQLKVFDGDGHSPHLESPDAFAAAVRAFEGGLG